MIYGVSRFVNGFFADRMSRKKMMAAGLFLSAVVNILIGLSPQMDGLFNLLDAEGKATTGLVVLIGSLWLINGYTQGMGYPPCGSLMAHWIKPSELATKQSNRSRSGVHAVRNFDSPEVFIFGMAVVLLHPCDPGDCRLCHASADSEGHTGIGRPAGS